MFRAKMDFGVFRSSPGKISTPGISGRPDTKTVRASVRAGQVGATIGGQKQEKQTKDYLSSSGKLPPLQPSLPPMDPGGPKYPS